MVQAPDEEVRTHVTRLLVNWQSGDGTALRQLTPIVYDELKKLARSYLARERGTNTLQPTALVHEAYLRLVDQNLPEFESRTHFYGVAAHLMRQILADHARARDSQKRGGGAERLPLEDAMAVAAGKPADFLALDSALNALSAYDERKCKVIEMRFFAGFSVEETAQALGISVATVGREQRLAQAWLNRELARAAGASID